nr:hypothetical protein [Tanacetum cinerariifolium]
MLLEFFVVVKNSGVKNEVSDMSLDFSANLAPSSSIWPLINFWKTLDVVRDSRQSDEVKKIIDYVCGNGGVFVGGIWRCLMAMTLLD